MVRDVELQGCAILDCNAFDLSHHLAELTIVAILEFALFFLHLNLILVCGLTSVTLIEVVKLVAHLSIKLDISNLLVVDDDVCPQVEVDDDDEVVLTRLEDGVFDVLVQHVNLVAPLSHESESVLVSLQSTLRLATTDDRSHGETVQLILTVGEDLELFLLVEPLLVDLHLILLLVPLLHLLDALEHSAHDLLVS